MSLNNLAQSIHNTSRAKGFWPADRNPGEVLMLIVTEAAEAMEAIRDGLPLNTTFYANVTGPDRTLRSKPEGLPSELADIIIRVLDACAAWDIDIDTAIGEKIKYNATRERLHGRAS